MDVPSLTVMLTRCGAWMAGTCAADGSVALAAQMANTKDSMEPRRMIFPVYSPILRITGQSNPEKTQDLDKHRMDLDKARAERAKLRAMFERQIP